MSNFRTLAIIRDWQDCRGPVKRVPTFVQVPGAWAAAVLSLVKLSEEHRHNGLVVTNVGPKSQAASAGLLRGDVLLRYHGTEVESVDNLRALTKRHHDRGEKTISIEVARGADDMHLKVQPGALGITVSPSLHRIKMVPVPVKGAPTMKPASDFDRAMPLITTLEQADKLDTTKPALVEVPAELARTVLSLVKSVEATGKQKKRAKALLTSVRS